MNKSAPFFLTLLLCGCVMAAEKKLKIYILAGQSNMEGHARIETFDYIGEDPATAPLLKQMRGADGKPTVCERVWITYYTGGRGNFGEGHGKLTAGYGSRGNPKESGGKIGPEFLFGLTMEQAYDGPILLIKTAWGGKSINTDFRPPSAGPYKLGEKMREELKKRKIDVAKKEAERNEKAGVYYREMIKHVKKVLADPKRVCPAYDEKAGYEVAGFVWFQGWNDMCDGQTYPDSRNPGGYAEYTRLMACFIRDVRKELSAPKMPFVIGVIGVGGDKATGGIANLRPAMAAPAKMDEFAGNVAAVETAPFWDHEMEALMPKKGQAEHRLRAAHVINDEGVMEKREDGPGWKPVGTPLPEKRVWRYTSFEPQKKDLKDKKEKKRFRDVTLPKGLENWYKYDFDDSKWKSGKAPIGKGVWKSGRWPKVKYVSEMGEGEFLLMRTTFTVDDLSKYKAFRISVLARQGFHIYLNGQKINTYIWWKDEPLYRPILLEGGHVKHLKKGVNVLAAYAGVNYDRRSGEPHAATDLDIEGITEADLKYVESREYVDKQYAKVCTPREAKIMRGSSNGGYHYLGSAKIMAQIGKAFAEAVLKMEKK